ncbi:Centromere protein B [Balamuthia mandrillaris]
MAEELHSRPSAAANNEEEEEEEGSKKTAESNEEGDSSGGGGCSPRSNRSSSSSSGEDESEGEAEDEEAVMDEGDVDEGEEEEEEEEEGSGDEEEEEGEEEEEDEAEEGAEGAEEEEAEEEEEGEEEDEEDGSEESSEGEDVDEEEEEEEHDQKEEAASKAEREQWRLSLMRKYGVEDEQVALHRSQKYVQYLLKKESVEDEDGDEDGQQAPPTATVKEMLDQRQKTRAAIRRKHVSTSSSPPSTPNEEQEKETEEREKENELLRLQQSPKEEREKRKREMRDKRKAFRAPYTRGSTRLFQQLQEGVARMHQNMEEEEKEKSKGKRGKGKEEAERQQLVWLEHMTISDMFDLRKKVKEEEAAKQNNKEDEKKAKEKEATATEQKTKKKEEEEDEKEREQAGGERRSSVMIKETTLAELLEQRRKEKVKRERREKERAKAVSSGTVARNKKKKQQQKKKKKRHTTSKEQKKTTTTTTTKTKRKEISASSDATTKPLKKLATTTTTKETKEEQGDIKKETATTKTMTEAERERQRRRRKKKRAKKRTNATVLAGEELIMEGNGKTLARKPQVKSVAAVASDEGKKEVRKRDSNKANNTDKKEVIEKDKEKAKHQHNANKQTANSMPEMKSAVMKSSTSTSSKQRPGLAKSHPGMDLSSKEREKSEKGKKEKEKEEKRRIQMQAQESLEQLRKWRQEDQKTKKRNNEAKQDEFVISGPASFQHIRHFDLSMDKGKKILLDVSLIEARGLPPCDEDHKMYCSVALLRSVQSFKSRTIKSYETNPVLEHDLTFTYYDKILLNPRLMVRVYCVKPSRFGKRVRSEIGRVTVDLSLLEDKIVNDLWLDLEKPLKKKGRWIGVCLPDEECGFVHLRIQKHWLRKKGVLSYYGWPLQAIPLRVEAGDIVLFSDNDLAKQAVQFACQSQWDHMAMVIRLRDRKGVFLFEATMAGVDVYKLDQRLDLYRETAKLGIRRLQLERTSSMLEVMYDFVEEVVGKPYNSNFVQLVKAKFGGNSNDADVSKFFCSQLVAACYQRMGLLSTDIAATNFLPAHFEPCKRLKLLKGRLGEVMVIPKKSTAQLGEMLLY